MTTAETRAMPEFICPEHGTVLVPSADGQILKCTAVCWFPIKGNIPRFVRSENYSAAFGTQWKHFAKTQLDSHTGVPISRNRLTRLCGGDLSILKGKNVLEAGCGAGRFTEVMLDAGAMVTAIDLSSAVEACRDNNASHPNLQLAQADILQLPFAEKSFDICVCIGVVQHTPSSRQTLAALARQIKPGGMLIFDHYPPDYAVTPSRALLRRFMLRLPRNWTIPMCSMLVSTLWPVHRILWWMKKHLSSERPYHFLAQWSPVVDYQEAYPQLGKMLREWAILDTHDTLTDVYKTLLGVDELRTMLEEIGMRGIALWRGGNGVESISYAPGAAVNGVN